MKNLLKVVIVVLVAYIARNITSSLLLSFLTFYKDLPMSSSLIIINIIFVIYFSILWIILFHDKTIAGTLFNKIKLKKIYLLLLAIFVFLFLVSFNRAVENYTNTQPISYDKFIGNSVYENDHFGFKLTYPVGSIFEHAHPEAGFVTRFFIPNGQTIKGDQENIGIHVEKYDNSLEGFIQQRKDSFSKYAPLDIEQVQFGGQKGYRMIFVTDYDAPKNTKELSYITIKNGNLYELNYFPIIDANIQNIDKIAQTFEFVQ